MSNEAILKALETIATTYPKVEVVSIGGIIACFGTMKDGKVETTVFGNLPEFTVANVKKLYNAKWSQRQLGYMYGTSQAQIANFMKNREVNVPNTVKGY
ncbi:hypothetical protein RAY_80 [Erwinia phage vB_EamM_RAY]|uniref:Uncharacterized protein n=10 Tax=Agricanvirus TaxID=1984776 RepID=A0A173GDT3_9CAUD|nr:hypothetical protein Ea357_080 [Erwinia phage Ea35-70]YP_009605226.1 hypothetical protein FDH97_gp083 [Erwinia phage vB_EamM_Deimos-Minion]YP_009605547.1 hypothetical protein FDH98_gp080 [Erwinia phage vB_EamM_RAY]YP_009605867.1 hypothetical protein FDH99_gp083 [Erwinia phage vB_EamM_Simmy50]YP_009606189.1 hypothetical protein FDI00_gp083 [Erwinia phage vB_EamM_Special G]YP_009621821.1 hypothetical protein FDJ23_gp080 [Erwinia phage vB_EamM_Desertfox]AUG85869.1 hypothetical protein BOSOLAP